MKSIQVLDCTLRDGGYCNDCRFGFDNQKKIIKNLLQSNIDIIECGFYMDNIKNDKDLTRFMSMSDVMDIIPDDRENKTFVMLADYGKFDPDRLPECGEDTVDGLRIAFHKKNMQEGIETCRKVKLKGYKVFVQPMVSLSYTDEEFLHLINAVNDLEPYALYIVDSFGMMKRKDLMRMFHMVEHNLKENIYIGFHSHNNMQLAFSNAQELVDENTNRNIIIDTSVYGMGRGAGNLNTELFVEYLNENAGGNYKLKPLLNIIDEILDEFYQRNSWGYSLPNYLSAVYNAHPNYAGYLNDKKTLTVEDMNEIFLLMSDDKKVSFDKNYIEEIYLQYMESGKLQYGRSNELKNILAGKKVLLIASGKSSVDEIDKIIMFSENENVVTMSINFDYTGVDTDFIFLSNLRRYRELDVNKQAKCIVTSRIPADNVYFQTDYHELLNKEENVRDNAGLMAVKFLMLYEVEEIYLAGFDGYSHNIQDNYAQKGMVYRTSDSMLDSINAGMGNVLKQYTEQINIKFLTTPKYINIV